MIEMCSSETFLAGAIVGIAVFVFWSLVYDILVAKRGVKE